MDLKKIKLSHPSVAEVLSIFDTDGHRYYEVDYLSQNVVYTEVANPESNDILARNELYLQFEVSKSNFFMRKDSVASGADTSGSRFNPQSSYQIGKRTR